MNIIKRIIFWSGGGDSTYLIYKLATENPREIFEVVSFHNPMFPIYEKFIPQYKEKVKQWLKEKNIFNINFFDVDMFSNSSIKEPQKFPYTILLYYLHIIPFLEAETIIYQGFIKEDCELHDKYLLFDHFNNLSKFLNQDIKIEFPLEYISKIEVLEKLIELGLYDKVMWCVSLDKNGKPCYSCRNCYMQEQARAGLYMKKTHKELPIELMEVIYRD